MTDHQDVLISLRRILRAADLHAKQIARATGLTPSQLLLLQTIRQLGEVAISRVAKEINLTQATVTTILDRLEQRGLVYRQRDSEDKRVVHALLTADGASLLEKAPIGLQRQFLDAFDALVPWERSWVLGALQRVGQMMQADDIDASPVLDVGDIDRLQDDTAMAEPTPPRRGGGAQASRPATRPRRS